MQKVLVISDSHKNNQTIRQIVMLENPNCLIFCGDLLIDVENLALTIPTFLVKGNWDVYRSGDVNKIKNIEQINVFITHGHKYRVKNNLNNLLSVAQKANCTLVCYGHTHKQNLTKIGGITLVNPGFCAIGEYAIIKIDKNNISVNLKKLDQI